LATQTDHSDDPHAGGNPRWFSAAALTLAAAAVGYAIHIRDGEYWPQALKWITVAMLLTIAGVAFPHVRDRRRGGRVLLGALVAAVVFQFLQLLCSPPGGWNWWSNDVRDLGWGNLRLYYAGITCAAFLSAGLVLDVRAMRAVCLPLLFAVHLAVGAWMIRSSPLPAIDVFAFQQLGPEALLAGKNPYAVEMPDIYHGTQQERDRAVYGRGLSQDGKLKFGFPYPPLSLYLATAGYKLAGDHRYAQLVAFTLGGVFIACCRPGRVAALAAVLLLFTPRAFFILGRGWTEPLVVCFLAATVFCACRGLRLLPVALGLLLASKQYLVFALPAVYLLVPPPRTGRQVLRLVGGALVTALLVSAPLILWDWAAFVHSAGTVQKLAPFREDALSYLVWIYRQWRVEGGVGVAFVAMMAGMVIALWRSPRDPAGFAAALALIFLPFIAFNKQAFANYYLFVIAALCCAVAAMPLFAESAAPGVRPKSVGPPVR
jgi:4-amino-4-deoxy-L-arabinose transferase-like glycosyltransferase